MRPLPKNLRVDELFCDDVNYIDYSVKSPSIQICWENFFYATEQVLRLLDKLPIKPTRDLALKKSKEWILEHQEADGSRLLQGHASPSRFAGSRPTKFYKRTYP